MMLLPTTRERWGRWLRTLNIGNLIITESDSDYNLQQAKSLHDSNDTWCYYTDSTHNGVTEKAVEFYVVNTEAEKIEVTTVCHSK
jgi:hypothetical protein